MANPSTCRICGDDSEHAEYEALERLYDYWEPFPYFLCARCGCLQIRPTLDPREDYSKYYLEPIYRNTATYDTARELFRLPIPTWLVTMIGGPVLSHAEVYGEKPQGAEAWEIDTTRRIVDFYLGEHQPDPQWSVLDVGTSEGSFLLSLRKAGFQGRLLGIDPMLEEDIRYDEPQVTVASAEIEELDSDGEWDLVTFHHSLACIPEPDAALAKAARLLRPGGVCLVRTHVVPNYCWQQFGPDWIGIDPPRNLFLYSPDAIDRLADGAGLSVVGEPRYDSGSFQFWGSEQTRRRIALYSPGSFAVDPTTSELPVRSRMDVYEATARTLNGSGQGDMAAFLLTRR